jgi:hypothetical protein
MGQLLTHTFQGSQPARTAEVPDGTPVVAPSSSLTQYISVVVFGMKFHFAPRREKALGKQLLSG